MVKPRANVTFEQSRKKLLPQMISKSKDKALEKEIHFRNDDVPKFLQNLDKFEKQSCKSRLIVK